MTLDFNTYQALALRTKSDTENIFFKDKVSLETLFETTTEFVKSGQDLDKIKKSLFYGKDFTGFNKSGQQINFSAINLDLLHALLGIATEGVELVELLQRTLINNEKFDVINLQEELGDLLWYLAIALHADSIDISVILEKNIAKLQARYPDKFSTDKANERDLPKEEDALKSPVKVTVTGAGTAQGSAN